MKKMDKQIKDFLKNNMYSHKKVIVNTNIGKKIIKDLFEYLLDKPKGVRGRSSNNERLKKVLNWNYSVKLKEGIKKTYDWIYEELTNNSINTKKYTRNADLLI